jgi:hypothetical protein
MERSQRFSSLWIPALLLALAGCAEEPMQPVATTAPSALPPQVNARPAPGLPPATATTRRGGSTVAGAGAGVSGSSTMPMPGARMTANEIANTLTSNTVVGYANDGTPYYAYFLPNGEQRFRIGSTPDTGTWRVLGSGELCSRLVRINNGAEQCYWLYRNGDSVLFENVAGAQQGSFRVLPGDPQRL